SRTGSIAARSGPRARRERASFHAVAHLRELAGGAEMVVIHEGDLDDERHLDLADGTIVVEVSLLGIGTDHRWTGSEAAAQEAGLGVEVEQLAAPLREGGA